MATRGACASSVRVRRVCHDYVPRPLSGSGSNTVRDTSGEIDFDFVGRVPGPQEQEERKLQEGAQRYHHENEDEYSAPLSTMRAAVCR